MPTRTDPVAAAASEVIGGPLGRYAAPARHTARSLWQPAAAVLVGLTSLILALGVLQKAHRVSQGWNTPDQFWHACEISPVISVADSTERMRMLGRGRSAIS